MPHWMMERNVQWVLAGCVLLGISSGVLGSFALLRRRSLMGDALATMIKHKVRRVLVAEGDQV